MARLGIPSGYSPYERLMFCSNELVKVRVPIQVHGEPVVLVGKGGDGPAVWLSVPERGGEEGRLYVVVGNDSLHDELTVEKERKSTRVVAPEGICVLEAREDEAGNCEVTRLDLRPLGLNIEGTEERLRVGNRQLIANTFRAVAAMIDVTPRPAVRWDDRESWGTDANE